MCFQIGIKDFELEVFYYFSEKLPLSQKLRYFRGSRFPQWSPMLVTKSVFKLIFVLSNYQMCTFPLKPLDPFGTEEEKKSSQIYK